MSPILQSENGTRLLASDEGNLSNPPIDQAEQTIYRQWRADVVQALDDAQRYGEAANFNQCGMVLGNFQVVVCDEHPEHNAKILPFRCHLRICPDCEHIEQARKVAKYTAVIKTITDDDPRDGWSTKKLELTTKFCLSDDDAEAQFLTAWEYFEDWLQLVCQRLLIDELTPDEKRRGRILYKPHGIGALVSVEYGEDSHLLHFHIIAYCPFFPKDLATDAWREVTGGEAYITHIRRIDYHDVENQVREQIKYVTKFQKLPPRLVVKLAEILDGQRRFRTYGTFRGAEDVDPEPCTCPLCNATITVMYVTKYFELMFENGIDPQADIASAGAHFLLNLKHGNKAGEKGEKLARGDPDPPTEQANLPAFDEVFNQKPRFKYQ
jgi:hypothetical protein